MVMISPSKGDAFRALRNGIGGVDAGDEIDDTHLSKLSANYLHEASTAPLSPLSPVAPLSPSQSRNQGFPLSNSKTQLLRLNDLYDDNEDESLNRSLDRSRDYSREYSHLDGSREEADFYLNQCESTSPNRTPIGRLYQTSSTSSTDTASSYIDHVPDENDSEFLIEARKSLKAIQEWDRVISFSSDDGNSSCGASCNSSYDGNSDVNKSFDTLSACGYDDIYDKHSSRSDDTPRSCPDLSENEESRKRCQPTNAKVRLQEIQDDEFEQRNRIAHLIAETSRDSNTSHTPKFLKRIGSHGMLKSPSNLFRSKEKIEHHHKNDSWKEKQGKERQRLKKQNLMRSILLNRRSWQSPTSFLKSQRKSKFFEEDIENKIGNRTRVIDAGIAAATPAKEESSPDPSNEKELQVKRAMLGNARVLTMDGIVESFADAATPPVSEQDSLYRKVRDANLAPTSDAPLTWV